MAAEFWLKAGDVVPSITATLTDANDDPIDISQADVTFLMTRIDADSPTVEAPAANLQVVDDDATIGHVRYDWVAGDTDVAGGYRGEWRVAFAEGPGTMPNNAYVAIAILPSLSPGGS